MTDTMRAMDALVRAAKDLVDRWNGATWGGNISNIEGTTAVVNRLRVALAALDRAPSYPVVARPAGVFDPNWGEPVLLLSTIRSTGAEAIAEALTTDERGASLYAAGGWEAMARQGFFVAPIAIAASLHRADTAATPEESPELPAK